MFNRYNMRRLFVLIIVLAGVYHAVSVSYTVLTASPQRRVQFIPDDAFYYLTLARNFATQGSWTFDSGVSLTSGFHPLHGYVLAAIYAGTNVTAEEFISASVLLNILLALVAVLVGAAFVFRRGSILASLLILLFLISRNVSLNLVSAVEWGWIVSLSALYCLAFVNLGGYLAKRNLVALCVLGLFGSLARSDFGLLPAALVVASLRAVWTPAGRKRIFAPLLGLASAIVGVGIGVLHNYLATGQFLQSSAKMKSLWLETYGPSTGPIIQKTTALFGPGSTPTEIPAAVLIVCAIGLGMRGFLVPWFSHLRRKSDGTHGGQDQYGTLWFGVMLATIGYMFFYSFNPAAVQPWYTGNLVVPIFLAIGIPLIQCRPNILLSTLAAAALITMIGMQVPLAYRMLDKSQWPHQVSMYRAGNYLHETNLEDRVGSWNAGIIGYYAGGDVINLDGLVNNDIYDYVATDALPVYIDSTRIRYIVDFEQMLTIQDLRRRGGYDDQDFLDRLVPVMRFDDRTHGWHRLMLFEVASTQGTLSGTAAVEDGP